MSGIIADPGSIIILWEPNESCGGICVQSAEIDHRAQHTYHSGRRTAATRSSLSWLRRRRLVISTAAGICCCWILFLGIARPRGRRARFGRRNATHTTSRRSRCCSCCRTTNNSCCFLFCSPNRTQINMDTPRLFLMSRRPFFFCSRRLLVLFASTDISTADGAQIITGGVAAAALLQ